METVVLMEIVKTLVNRGGIMGVHGFGYWHAGLEASRALGEAMPGLDIAKLPESELLQTRGW